MGPFWTLVKTRIEASNLTPDEKADVLSRGKLQIQDYFNGKGTRAGIMPISTASANGRPNTRSIRHKSS